MEDLINIELMILVYIRAHLTLLHFKKNIFYFEMFLVNYRTMHA
ncbi:hypothetical protein MUDAN_DOGOELCO_02236 [Lactiplantibacillus mudanjiangensis]|nr:hypothetical protein MUDAN_DOGOELCO_02236 [Lactiplantibacillus mudanjiangensis]